MDYNSAFTVLVAASGSVDTTAKDVAEGQTIVVPIWGYSTLPADGDMVYLRDGGSEVSLGPPVSSIGSSSNSDRAGAFVLTNAPAGSYVLRSKNNSYRVAPPILLDAKPNCRVYVAVKAEDTGTVAVSGSIDLPPVWANAIAVGFLTHNQDSFGIPNLQADTSNGWALIHEQEDYDGSYQPGIAQWKKFTAAGTITSTINISYSVTWLQGLIVVAEPDEVYEALDDGSNVDPYVDGAHTVGVVGVTPGPHDTDTIVLPSIVPPGYGVIVPIGMYAFDPDTTHIYDDGGNTWVLDVQSTYGGTGNDGSASCFRSVLTNPCGSITIDTTAVSLPDTDAGHWWRWGVIVVEKPDTVNGFLTATPQTNVETSVSVVDPGGVTPLTPTTDLYLLLMGWTNRNHASQLLPWSVSSGITQGFQGVENSDATAFSFVWGIFTSTSAQTPTVTLAMATGAARSFVIAYSLLGGNPAGGGFFSGTIGLASVSSLVEAAAAQMSRAVGMGTSTTMAGGSARDHVSTLSLPTTSALAQSKAAAAMGIAALSAVVDMSNEVSMAGYRAIDLSASGALTIVAGAVARIWALALSAQSGLDPTAAAFVSLLVSLPGAAAFDSTTEVEEGPFQGTIDLASQAALAQAFDLASTRTLEFAVGADLAIAEAITRRAIVALGVPQAAFAQSFVGVLRSRTELVTAASLSFNSIRALFGTLPLSGSTSVSASSRLAVELLASLPANASVLVTNEPTEPPFQATLSLTATAMLQELMTAAGAAALDLPATVEYDLGVRLIAARRIADELRADIATIAERSSVGLVLLGMDASFASRAAVSLRRQLTIQIRALLEATADPPPLVGVLKIAGVMLSESRVRDFAIIGAEQVEEEEDVDNFGGVTVFGKRKAIGERSTRKIGCQLYDESNAKLTDDAQVTSIKLTLRDDRSNAIINAREDVEVKDQNGGTLSETGWFEFKLTPDDTAAFGPDQFQRRRMTLEFTFDGVSNSEQHEVYFYVRNLPGVS